MGCPGPCALYTLSALDPPYPASIRAGKNSRKNGQKVVAAPRALFQLLALPPHITHQHCRPTAQTSRHFRESARHVINPRTELQTTKLLKVAMNCVQNDQLRLIEWRLEGSHIKQSQSKFSVYQTHTVIGEAINAHG